MAVTAGSGGTGTVDTTAATIFDSTAGTPANAVTSLQIWNTGTTNSLKVLVTGLHDVGGELSLAPGKTTVVRVGTKELSTCQVSAAAGTTEVHWGAVAITGQEW